MHRMSHSTVPPAPRRNPSRATKTESVATRPFFYKEVKNLLLPRQEYFRVDHYKHNDRFRPKAKQCNKEMIGQHIAKYLLMRGAWAVWFHHGSSQFIIARKKDFVGYDIEGAAEGESKFTGYAALAEWAFESEGNIYQKSLDNADGTAFLNGIGCDKDDVDKIFA